MWIHYQPCHLRVVRTWINVLALLSIHTMKEWGWTTSQTSIHTNFKVQLFPRTGLDLSWSFLHLCSFTQNCTIFFIGVKRFVNLKVKYRVWDLFKKLTYNHLPVTHIHVLFSNLGIFSGELRKDKRGAYFLNVCLMIDLLWKQIF